MRRINKKNNQLESTDGSFDKAFYHKSSQFIEEKQKKHIPSREYMMFVVPWQMPPEDDERNKKATPG